jgi:hypothetical protein
MRPSVRRTLRENNMSVAHLHPVIDLLEPNTQIAGRPVAGIVAVCDIRLNWYINDVDTTEEGYVIDEADPITGTIV